MQIIYIFIRDVIIKTKLQHERNKGERREDSEGAEGIIKRKYSGV
jgi:hypothetical protein